MCDVKCKNTAKSDSKANANNGTAKETEKLFRGLKPLSPSPLVKLARWSFLIMGIVYGVNRQRFLAEREVGIREEEEKLKKEKEAYIAEEKQIASEKDIQSLADLAEH